MAAAGPIDSQDEPTKGSSVFRRNDGTKDHGAHRYPIPGDVVVYTHHNTSAQNVRFEVAVERALDAPPSNLTYYHRFQCNGTVWNSESYPMPKRANCVAQLGDGSFGIVQAHSV